MNEFLSDDNILHHSYLEIEMKVNFSTIKPIATTHFKSKKEQNTDPAPQTAHKKNINPASLTGWIGLGAMVTAVVSGILHKPKLHKASAFIGVASIAAHVGIIETYHHKKTHN